MTTFVASLLISLDGRNANYESIPDADEHEEFNHLFAASDSILFDRSDYDLLVPYWDEVDITDPDVTEVERDFARIFRTKPRLVIAPDLEEVDPQAELIRTDPIPYLTALRQEEHGTVLVSAGADLLTVLFAHNLIDELHVMVRPYLIGGNDSPTNRLLDTVLLTLLETRTLASGTLILRYRLREKSDPSAA